MKLADLYFLRSPEGQEWLQTTAVAALTPANHLQLASQLRQQLPPALAQAVLETVLLRQKAAAKFSRADQMYFVRAALEQASSELVATYRARRFAVVDGQPIADLGCGLGGDALALAAYGPVIGVERDEVRLALARENVAAYGRGDRFWPLCADLLTLPPLPVRALFFDPARRDAHGRRLYSVQQYRPPLALVGTWRVMVPETAVKISPGVDYAELPADAEVEFISLAGELKEAVLWFGRLRTEAQRRATLLPEGHTLVHNAYLPPVPVTLPQGYLYEPDSAVIRAHLVEELAHQLGASKIEETIAYLTAVDPHPTPFATCYALEAAMPFQLKRLRHYLHSHDIGQVTIKKRGSPLEPDALQHQLRLRGSQHRILFLTQSLGQPIVLIGQQLKPKNDEL